MQLAVSRRDGATTLRVADDRRGFSRQELERRRAANHVSTRLLAQLVEQEAQLSIDSEPGSGTVVTLRIADGNSAGTPPA